MDMVGSKWLVTSGGGYGSGSDSGGGLWFR